MKIIIQTIPHSAQPYSTCGDWRYAEDGTLLINVSEEVGEGNAFLVALHELVEARLCQKRGITCEAVDKFDKAYEKTRPDGDDSEPGDHPDAPYRKEHFFATTVERMMSAEMGIDWSLYEAVINKLP